MTTEQRTSMTDDEARALAEKVTAWAETMGPNERAVLEEIFLRAGATAGVEADEVAGYKIGDGKNPLGDGLIGVVAPIPGVGTFAVVVYAIARDLQDRI